MVRYEEASNPDYQMRIYVNNVGLVLVAPS